MLRPNKLSGYTYRIKTGCGNMYVTITIMDDTIYEVFAQLGKAGSCAVSQLEALCRMISLALQNGISIEYVIKHLSNIQCPNPIWDNNQQILSCADGISKIIKQHLTTDGQTWG